MPEPLNWKTRLEITVDGKVLSPIDSFTTQFSTPATVIHSIEADNIGAVYQPQTATFNMTLRAIGTNVAELTRMALDGRKFNISVAEKRGTDWTFSKLLFRDCVITSSSPSNVTVDGAPTANFSGIILGFTADSDVEV
jgi:hypothetical protein